MVVPRDGGIWTDYAYAASHVFNGNGEMTGLAWVQESGMLGSPIGITNTYQVGMVRDFLAKESVRVGVVEDFLLPVVGETDDGWLSDASAFALTEEDAAIALSIASGGAVAEGCVGGGTGMICHEFKGGIGTSSRVVEIDDETYVVGVLVQANYGAREDFRIDGVPVGALIGSDKVPSPWTSRQMEARSSSSSRPMPHCCPVSAGGWRIERRSAWPESVDMGMTPVATCSSPSPPATIWKSGRAR